MNLSYRLKVSLSKRIEFRSTHVRWLDSFGNELSKANSATCSRVLELWYRMAVDNLTQFISISNAYDVCCSWLSKQPEVLQVDKWIGLLEQATESYIRSCTINLDSEDGRYTDWLSTFFRSRMVRRTIPRRDYFTLLRFPKRITLNDVDALEETTREAFFTNVDRVQGIWESGTFAEEPESIWIQEWMSDYQAPNLDDCSFSAGCVAQRSIKRNALRKANELGFDEYIFKFCVHNRIPLETIKPGEFFSSSMLKMRDRIQSYTPSCVQFVPKSYKTYRSVAMEDNSRMFYQNAVLKQIRKVIKRKLSRHIDLEDQERSRELALEASHSRAFATIDQSMASDSVSLSVLDMFRNTPAWDDLNDLRAKSFTYKDYEYECPIAFTMGSPLCFPIECIVFLAIAYVAVERCGGDPRTETILVYGDDVILPSKYAEAFMHRCSELGFLPNADKSYWQQEIPFREACGMEAWDGEDITPLYIPRGFSANVANSLGSYIHLCNACFGRGYLGTRKKIEYWLTKPIPVYRRHSRKARKIVPKIPYSDDIDVLTNESSTEIFDPMAFVKNKPNIIHRNVNDKRSSSVCKQPYLMVTMPTAIKMKDDKLPEPEAQRAKLDLYLISKGGRVDTGGKYRRRTLSELVRSGKVAVFNPELTRSFDPTVTRMAISIRPYWTVLRK